ncbi:hypothetical protein ZHAS_00013000 [Anopheles sinensis]|uniref:Uncharacterized protein n=1 Tax=Anopheles sinensis TaxID=74873 RepID=A0A084W4D8_ANOSI|nr:hypothetical protein ZHAS_00013000 [Anopheles sinensis]
MKNKTTCFAPSITVTVGGCSDRERQYITRASPGYTVRDPRVPSESDGITHRRWPASALSPSNLLPNSPEQIRDLEFGVNLMANQLSDIICRATQPSIQSAGNTLTRGTSLRDTGDYAVPHPHPHTHHYMSTSATPPSLSRVGSCPGSTGGSGSGHGSGSGSSPGGGPGSGGGGSGSVGGGIGGGGVGGGSIGVGICGGSILGGSQGRLEYIECSHYDRMPLPIPVQIPIVPPPQLHSEDEIEPAYATEHTIRLNQFFEIPYA